MSPENKERLWVYPLLLILAALLFIAGAYSIKILYIPEPRLEEFVRPVALKGEKDAKGVGEDVVGVSEKASPSSLNPENKGSLLSQRLSEAMVKESSPLAPTQEQPSTVSGN